MLTILSSSIAPVPKLTVGPIHNTIRRHCSAPTRCTIGAPSSSSRFGCLLRRSRETMSVSVIACIALFEIRVFGVKEGRLSRMQGPERRTRARAHCDWLVGDRRDKDSIKGSRQDGKIEASGGSISCGQCVQGQRKVVTFIGVRDLFRVENK